MSNFRVGQRIRIVCPNDLGDGKSATIWKIVSGGWVDSFKGPKDATGYRLDVDGIGRKTKRGTWIAYEAHELRPLTDPAADQFIANLEKLSREPLIPLPEVEHEAK